MGNLDPSPVKSILISLKSIDWSKKNSPYLYFIEKIVKSKVVSLPLQGYITQYNNKLKPTLCDFPL